MPDARWLQHLLDAATVDESVLALRPDYRALLIPVGGEDLDRYVGSARLRRAVGVEPFETVAGGMHMVNYLDPAQAP